MPSPVLPELDYLVRSRIGPEAFLDVLEEVDAGRLAIEDLTLRDYARAREIVTTYLDAGVGFVDSAVLAVVERLEEPKLATLDRRHFTLMRPRHREALELLP